MRGKKTRMVRHKDTSLRFKMPVLCTHHNIRNSITTIQRRNFTNQQISSDQKHGVKCTENTRSNMQANVKLITHLQHNDLRHMLIQGVHRHYLTCRLFQTYSLGFHPHTDTQKWRDPEMLGFVIYCICAYPSLQIACYPVNKVEIVKGSMQEDISSSCQITNMLL